MRDPAFSVDTPEQSPGLLLWQTTQLWQRLIKQALAPFDISHAQLVILAITLWFTSKEQTVTQMDIVEQSKLDKMTVSKSLKKLASLQLVQRKEFNEDTRVKTVVLTPKGKALARKLVPIVEGIDSDFFGQISVRSQDQLMSILRTLSV